MPFYFAEDPILQDLFIAFAENRRRMPISPYLESTASSVGMPTNYFDGHAGK